LGVGGWGPNPKSPIPNPQSPIPIKGYLKLNNIKKNLINYIKIKYYMKK